MVMYGQFKKLVVPYLKVMVQGQKNNEIQCVPKEVYTFWMLITHISRERIRVFCSDVLE
jgi:hypothetical protein